MEHYEYKPEGNRGFFDIPDKSELDKMQLKNRDVENPSDDPEVIKCAAALNDVIGFRGLTLESLSERCGIDVNTLQKYTDTSLDIRKASALDVMHIASALDVDPAILLGEKPIEDFKDAEKKEGRGIDPSALEYLRKLMAKPIREEGHDFIKYN